MERYDIVFFKEDLGQLGITLTDRQVEQFLQYYEMLTEWNQVMNLTAIMEYRDVMKKHFVDSLSLVKVCDLKDGLSLIDVGTGAGFPGLALKIAFPGLKITLLDSLNKRITFLNEVIDKLKLSDVETVHGRAEDHAKPGKLREVYDICVSRAVANLSTLSEYCLPFVKVGGVFVSYKSEKVSQELTDAKEAIKIMGGDVKDQIEFILPGTDFYRCLVIIEKYHSTPVKYPRKAGIPTREPL